MIRDSRQETGREPRRRHSADTKRDDGGRKHTDPSECACAPAHQRCGYQGIKLRIWFIGTSRRALEPIKPTSTGNRNLATAEADQTTDAISGPWPMQ